MRAAMAHAGECLMVSVATLRLAAMLCAGRCYIEVWPYRASMIVAPAKAVVLGVVVVGGGGPVV